MITVEIKNWSGSPQSIMVGMDDYMVPDGTHILMVDDIAGGMTNTVMVDWNGNMETLSGGQGWQLTSGLGMPMVYEVPGGDVADVDGFMLVGFGVGACIAVLGMTLNIARRMLGPRSYD